MRISAADRRLFRARQRIIELVLTWESVAARVMWVGLPTAVGGDADALRAHWKQLHAEMEARLGVPVEYVGVRTSEGNGVLHLLAAAQPEKGRAWSTVCDCDWLAESWGRIHGAPNGTHIRAFQFGTEQRIAHYMTFKQVPYVVEFLRSRRRFVEVLGRSVYQSLRAWVVPEWRVVVEGGAEFGRLSPRLQEMQKAWRSLLRSRQCEVDGQVLVVVDGSLVPV
jgi:hypothetical protein